MKITDTRKANLRSIIKSRSLTTADFARTYGLDPSYLSQILNGHRGFGEKSARNIEKKLGLGAGHLDSLLSEPDRSAFAMSEPTVAIPRLDVSASMGNGSLMPENHIDVIEQMSVNIEYLRRTISYSMVSNLAIITGYGDSMEGTFSDGDLLLVDQGVNVIKLDAVYVLGLGNELYIKRIQRRPDGSYLMLSDNVKYPPYEIKNGELSTFQVLARVLLVWNAKRL